MCKLQNLTEITNDNHNLSNERYAVLVSPSSSKNIRISTEYVNNRNRTFLLRATNNGGYGETISILTIGNGVFRKYDITTDSKTTFAYNDLGTLAITNNNPGNIEIQISPLQFFEKEFSVTEL